MYRAVGKNREPRNEPPHIWSNDFWKDTTTIQWGERQVFNKLCWENWISTCKRRKLDPYLIPYTKISSQWTKDVNLRPETIKLQNMTENLHDIDLGIDFWDLTPRPQATKAKIDKWDCIKLKKLHIAKEMVVKSQPMKWEKIVGNHISDKELIFFGGFFLTQKIAHN